MSDVHLDRLRIQQLRCLSRIEFAPSAGHNVICGDNGAGKSSLLEAIHLLSRGQSFRSTPSRQLIQDGQVHCLLFGDLTHGEGRYRLAMQRSVDGTRLKLNQEAQTRQSAFARLLPVLLIDPGQHRLLEDGPNLRRRFLDWSVFHVEPDYLRQWQRYRRALLQRNALLRQGAGASLTTWDEQFVAIAEAVAECRKRVFSELQSQISGSLRQLLGDDLGIEIRYRRGWTREQPLAELLRKQREQDLERGFTQSGPHRAELRVTAHRHAARDSLSRGQQKLVMSAMIFGQAAHFQLRLGYNPILLIDDLASELGRAGRERVLQWLGHYRGQLFMTALEPALLSQGGSARMFHVKHGALQPD